MSSGKCHGVSEDEPSGASDAVDIIPALKETDTWEDDAESEESKEMNNHKRNITVAKNSVLVSKQVSPLDSFLSFYCDFSGPGINQDRILKLAQWLLWFASHCTKNKSSNPELSPGLRKMYFDLSMARYALRLLGMPTALQAIRSGSWGGGGQFQNKKIDQIGQVMAWSMLFYYPLEYVAYAKWTSPKWIKADAEKFSAYSCRFWLVYIVGEMIQCILKMKELRQQKRLLMLEKESHSNKDDELQSEIQVIDKSIRLNLLQVVRDICFIPPCMNWSLLDWERKPWLKEPLVNGLMLTESIVCMYQSIRAKMG
mmetsp:Transcript_6748/g.12150  ORF Transcript_6748/g.12150 Transcript_6748/m.12150 type:complete len:312 (-) Transcript_6748:490-1425(-)|eukprot:CAMPEP_0198300944 /NCGR_PEP_ID=MMETSP1449-20131203/50036_1 /TAXON_ID=420275 /ORGANISM="Attheya septentrionalis, Strain CCMP2084" /LENGTH=311 /DNA_ID=CAMNT_0044002901 /DNA_START=125 /DNA_END=1060 /DNA_ORIENTATION=-